VVTSSSGYRICKLEPGAAKLPGTRKCNHNSGVPAAVVPRTNSILEIFLSTIGALHRAGILIVAGTIKCARP